MRGLLRRLWPRERARAGAPEAPAPGQGPEAPEPDVLKLVVGLGNPGRRYASTRHNAGVRVLERLAGDLGIAVGPSPLPEVEGAFGRGVLAEDDALLGVALLAPHTFMNRSGETVAAALAALGVRDPASDLLVILDDVDLPFGRLRVRAGGGAGGHRGLADVIARLGRRDFPRLRVGVGRPPEGGDTAEHVLAPFSEAEERALPAVLERASRAAQDVLRLGAARAMDRANRPEPAPDPAG